MSNTPVVAIFLAVLSYASAQNQFCTAGQISISGTCMRISTDGGPCIYTAQCQGVNLYCRNGFCRQRDNNGGGSNYPPVTCASTEILANGSCQRRAYLGDPCIFTAQCVGSFGMTCRNGFCRFMNDNGNTGNNGNNGGFYDNPLCEQSNLQVERQNGRVKDCRTSACSAGFECEFNMSIQQYICCGQYNANTNYSYGTVRMYPGTSMPLQCFQANQCLFSDTPNCVQSSRYNYKVCCSTFNC